MQLFVCRTLAILLFSVSVFAQAEPPPAEAPADPAAEASAPQAPVPESSVAAPTNTKKGMSARQGDELNKTSSSFVPKPDPLDPLPVKKESLKDGDEAILEDIKEVLNRPKKEEPKELVTDQAPPPQEPPPPEIEPSAPAAEPVVESAPAEPVTPKVAKKKKSKKKSSESAQMNKKSSPRGRNDDDPDLNLERRFHNVYQTYNAEPTSEELWKQVINTQPGNMYTVLKGDNLYTLSKTFFGDPQFWPKVWAVNRETILNPHLIYPGMQIIFYPSVDGSVPVMATNPEPATEDVPMITNIGVTPSESPAGSAAAEGETASGDDSTVLGKYQKQNTEFIKLGTSAEKGLRTGKIPKSLPEYRNAKYFSSRGEKSLKIELTPFAPPPPAVPENPYILTSEKLMSEFRIPMQHVEKLGCRTNLYIPKVEKVEKESGGALVPGEYVIVSSMSSALSKLKTTQIYKRIGVIRLNPNMSARILSCMQLMNSDTLFVKSTTLMSAPPATEILGANGPAIVDGLDHESQESFTVNQFVVVNTSQLAAQDGQNLSVMSESIGSQVGEMKLIRRFGSLGVAVVTDQTEFIQLGDMVQAQ